MITVNNRDKLKWHKNMTVQAVLDAMGYNYPLITVTVNDKIVVKDDYDDYLVPQYADVKAIHIMHGG